MSPIKKAIGTPQGIICRKIQNYDKLHFFFNFNLTIFKPCLKIDAGTCVCVGGGLGVSSVCVGCEGGMWVWVCVGFVGKCVGFVGGCEFPYHTPSVHIPPGTALPATHLHPSVQVPPSTPSFCTTPCHHLPPNIAPAASRPSGHSWLHQAKPPVVCGSSKS